LDNSTSLYLIVYIIIPPIVGIMLNFINSDKYSEKIERHIVVCRDYLLKQINDSVMKLDDHYKNEINRVLLFALGGEKLEISGLDIIKSGLELTSELYAKFSEIYLYINKLEKSEKILYFFKIVFCILFCIAFVLIILIIMKSIIISRIIPLLFFIFSLFIILIYLFSRIITSNLLSKIRKKYALSI